MREAPPWLDDLQQPGEMGRLESRLGVVVPEVIRNFWLNPGLVRLLDVWRWETFLDQEPFVVAWDGAPHIVVALHGHSGLVGAARLDAGPDPPFFWGFEDEDEPYRDPDYPHVAFSMYLRSSLDRGPC
jgi:hypothetical protein